MLRHTPKLTLAATAAALALTVAASELRANITAEMYIECFGDENTLFIITDADPGKKLSIFKPNGDKVVKNKAKGPAGDLGVNGQTLTVMETDLDDIKSAWPAGNYDFVGKDSDGNTMEASANLSYAVPAAPEIWKVDDVGTNDTPVEDGDEINNEPDLDVHWNEVTEDKDGGEIEIDHYILEISCEDRHFERVIDPDDVATVPGPGDDPDFYEIFDNPAVVVDGCDGKDITVRVTAVATNGNRSVSEVTVEGDADA